MGLAIARMCGRFARASRFRPTSEEGFGLIEVVASLAIIFVGFFALTAAIGSSARVLTQGGQRQVASNEASGELEDLRNIPYANSALTTQLTYSPDESNPDHWVSSGGTSFDYDHDGTFEPLVIDAASGQVSHIGTELTGSTALTVYRYVTWVDDPAVTGTQDYKRVVVVAVYPAAVKIGRAHV